MRGRCCRYRCKPPTVAAGFSILLTLATSAGGAGSHIAVSSDWTGYWEVALDDMATMIMLYTDPTTASSPLCLVPSGGVMRSIEDPMANGSGMERWDSDGSVWQRVLLPLVNHEEGGSAPHKDASFGWALQGHADGTRYLRAVRRSKLHVARVEECFSNAAVGVDPNTGEHVILHANAAPISKYQPQQLSEPQHHLPHTGWGGSTAGGGDSGETVGSGEATLPTGAWDGDDPYAGFGAFPWGAQGQVSDEGPVVEETECTPALYMLWWLLALRHMLERPAALEKLWLRFLAQIKPQNVIQQKQQSCGLISPPGSPVTRRLSFD